MQTFLKHSHSPSLARIPLRNACTSTSSTMARICTWYVLSRWVSGAVMPGSVVNFTFSLQKWPKIQHSSPECLHQSLDFHERSFSPRVVSGYKFADKCADESAKAEL